MAELSAETEAIIQRLKSEGQLVRNSGTNSIKSVNVRLDRFDGLFKCMCNNLTEQTDMLRAQLGFAEEQRELLRRQRDFEEIAEKEEKSTSTETEVEKTREKNNRSIRSAIGDGLKSALSGIKLAGLIGLGGFAGYNLAKGFIDEVFNGAFSNMETSITNSVGKLGEINFEGLATSITNMQTSMASLATSLEGIKADIEKFKENMSSFGFWVSAITKAIGIGFALNAARKLALALDEINDKRITRRNPINLDPRLQGDGYTDQEYKIRQRQIEAERIRNTELERFERAQRNIDYNRRLNAVGAGPSPTGMFDGPEGMRSPGTGTSPNLRVVGGTGFNNTQFTAPGRLSSPTGPGTAANISTAPAVRPSSGYDQFTRRANNQTAANTNSAPATTSKIQELFKNAPDVPDKWKRAILKIFDFLAKLNIVLRVADIIYMLSIITSVDSEEERMKMIGGALGGLIGAGGGMALGAMAGMAGGPFAWITVPVGGLAGSVLGGYGGDWIGYKIVQWALGEGPSNVEIRRVNQEISVRTAEMAAEESLMAQPLLAPTETQMFGMNAQGFQMAAQSRAAIAAENEQRAANRIAKIGAAYAEYGRTRSLSDRLHRTATGLNGVDAQNSLLDALIKAEQGRQAQMQQITDYLTGAGAGGVTVVAPTTVAPTVNNIEGDKSASQTTILATGSSGPNYGLPGTVND